MKKRSKTRRNVEAVIWYIVMGILAILFVLPFIWMLSTAFKTGPQCVDYPPTFIPRSDFLFLRKSWLPYPSEDP